jgi:tripartite-type tricarboxylate transporter receptor subunit TctC
MKPPSLLLKAFVLGVSLCAPAFASAQGWPTHAVQVIVPYPPGGSSDVIARLLAVKLADAFKQPFLVDNRPGAGTMIGTTQVARAAPDGYTILIADVPFTVNASVLPKPTYDPIKDFAPITIVGVSAQFLYSNAAQFKSLAELIATGRSKPGEVTVASGGNGTASHLMIEMLQMGAGIKLVHVPYKGSAPALTDAAGGQVNAVFSTLASAAPHVASGKLRVLAVTSPSRLSSLPEVPTFVESGIPDMVVEHWWGFLGPAGMPRNVVLALNAQIAKAVAAPDVREKFAGLSVEPRVNTPEQFQQLVETYAKRWAKVARDANVKVE